MNNSGFLVTDSNTGRQMYIFADSIKVIRPVGTGSVIQRLGRSALEVDEAPAAIADAMGNIPLVMTEGGVTIYVSRSAIDRIVDDGTDDATVVFKDESSIATTTTFSTLGTKTQLAGVYVGTGTPESAVVAEVGSLFVRTDGGAVTTLYVKESGTGSTGWVAK